MNRTEPSSETHQSIYDVLLNLLSETNFCVLVTAELNDHIVKVNNALCLFLEKEADELLGTNASILIEKLNNRGISVQTWSAEQSGKSYKIFSFNKEKNNFETKEQAKKNTKLNESIVLQRKIESQSIFLNAVVESVPDAVIALDINGIVSSWNKEAVKLFDWTADEAIGKHIDSLVFSFKKDEIDTQSVVEGKVVRGHECIRWGKLSKKHKVFVSVAPIAVDGGEIRGAVGIYTDLADRDSILAVSRENEIKFRAITESAQDAVIMCDNNGLITFFNTSAERLFGYFKGETIGKKLYEIIAPEVYWDMISMGFSQFSRTGQGMMVGRVVEMEGRRKNGTTFPIELSVSSFLLNGNWNAVGILREISERKEIELELIEAREGALNAVRTKSEFLANMSHEIRTPLNAIIGTTDLLWESDMDDAQRNYLRISRNASENLLTLINDILDLSKVEAGRVELEQLEFNLIENVEKVCETLALRAHEKNIELNCWVHSGTPEWVIGDPARLRQILINLIGNSIKFTEKGEITLHLKPTDEENMLYFSVNDTGIGIPEGKLESIFMSFTQADSSHTRRFGGTGLGLTICYKLVELMDGKLRVESEVGKGSKFFFSCNLSAATKDDANPLLKDEIDSLFGKKILVLDNIISSQGIYKEILENVGLKVSLASTFIEAKELVQKTEFDSVLINLNIPEMNGFSIIEQLSAMGISKNKFILMFNSSDSGVNIKECQRNGIKHYLLKPVRRKSLLEQVVCSITQKKELVNSNLSLLPDNEHFRIELIKLRVLLVEDSVDNRFLIEKYFEALPWELTIAENGQIAYDLFLENEFDLVLMDMQMPVMDGYESTRSIRAYEMNNLRGHTPIIALTAHALQEEVRECISAGCDIHISKPIRKKVLLEEINSLMQNFQPKLEQEHDFEIVSDLDQFVAHKFTNEATPFDNVIQNTLPISFSKKEISKAEQDVSSQEKSSKEQGEFGSEVSTTSFVAYVPKDLETLIPGYLKNRQNDVVKIRELLDNNEFREVQRLAHSMKGSGGGYGFNEITEYGATMEQAAKAEDKYAILLYLNKLVIYLENVRIEFVDEDE